MEKTEFIGIDVSKKTLDLVIFNKKTKNQYKGEYIKVSNDKEGFKKIIKWCKSNAIKLDSTVVGMEHTGLYTFQLREFLEKNKIDYCMYNPLDLKRSLGMVRGKDDKVDASRIAYYTWLHREELKYSKLDSKIIQDLRRLAAERKRFVVELAEYKSIITDNQNQKKSSTIKRAEKMKKVIEEEIKEIEKEMNTLISEDKSIEKNFQLLRSIKGIGVVNAILTILYTDNFHAFENARQYACYVGVAPFEYSSGTSVRGKTRVSSFGPKIIKAELTQAAKSAIVHDKEIKIYYERKRGEGKAFGLVLNAIKFKMINRMFAVIKRGSPFVELSQYSA